MINWYSNKRVIICFDKLPAVSVRYEIPSMTKNEKISVRKYPFICKQEIEVILTDIKKYCYDGASIPRFFWRVIGSNTDNKFLIPALIHDVLCEHHDYIDNDRGFSTEVFNALLESSELFCLKRFVMKNSVNIFQKLFCKW